MPARFVIHAADFLGRTYELDREDRPLLKLLLPSTIPQSEIRVMTGCR